MDVIRQVGAYIPVFQYGRREQGNEDTPDAEACWLLQKYAKPGYVILDTHVGSASSLIAYHEAGYKYIGFEIDPYYYGASKKRLDAYMAQISLFDVGMERY